MIVVDASALVSAVVSAGRRGEAARRRLATEELAAPELIDIEFLNAISGLALAKRITQARAAAAVARVGSLGIERFRHEILIRRAWDLRHNLTPYDGTYIALAEVLDAPLVTGDARIAGAPGLRCSVEVLA